MLALRNVWHLLGMLVRCLCAVNSDAQLFRITLTLYVKHMEAHSIYASCVRIRLSILHLI